MAKKNEVTSSKVAAIAAKGLAHPESLSCCEISAVCGSALTQFIASGEVLVVPNPKIRTTIFRVVAKRKKRKGKRGRPKTKK